MRRLTKRAVWLGVATFVTLLALGGTAAWANEGMIGGWYWQNPLSQGNTLRDVSVMGSNVVAVGDGGSVMTSGDGGVTWKLRAEWLRWKGDSSTTPSTPPSTPITGARKRPLYSVSFVAAHPEKGWACGTGGIFSTTDGGTTWRFQDVPGAGTYNFTSVSFINVAHDPTNPNDDTQSGWAAGSYSIDGTVVACRIVRTDDGGANWDIAKQWTTRVENPPDDPRDVVQFLRQVDFVSATEGWATGWGFSAATNDWGYVVLKTTDGGATWTTTRFGDGRAGITGLEFTTATDGWLATGVIDGYVPATIWKTTDGGATWTAAKTRDGSTISDIAATASGEVYAAGRVEGLSDWKGIILHSTDGGATWTEEFAEDGENPNAVAFSGTAAIAVGDGALRLRRDAATAAWAQYEPGIRKNLTNVQFWDKQLGWAVGWKSTILRTADGGKKWVATNVPAGISLEGICMVSKKTGWAVGCSGPHVPYADMDAGYGAVVLKTTDGGLNWKFVLNRTTRPGLAGVDFTDTKHGVAVGTNGLTARTADGGKTWWLRTVGSETLRDIKFVDGSNAVMVGGDTNTVSGNGSMWKSTDGGASWTQVDLATPIGNVAPVRALFEYASTSEGTGFTAVGDRGQTYLSQDGVDWELGDWIPRIVTQDPPYMHGVDIGLTDLESPELVADDDAIGWILSDDGAIWTKPQVAPPDTPWVMPPTVSSFTPQSGSSGTVITVTGSGMRPNIPGDRPNLNSIGWVKVKDPGSGYSTPPKVEIVEQPAAGGRVATLVATVVNGAVSEIRVVDPGDGYDPGMYHVKITDTAVPSTVTRDATATAYTLGSTIVTFPNAGEVVASGLTDTSLRVEVPEGAVTGSVAVATVFGTGRSLDVFTVPGTDYVVQEHLLSHAGGSGQDNQLNGLSVVDWLDAWAVGEKGTILSFDRLPPKTTVSPSNGWVKSPTLTLSSADAKSGIWTVRWCVNPPGISGDVHPPISNWDNWDWQYGTNVTWEGKRQDGNPPGARDVVYYQAIDNVGNIELDPFWLKWAFDNVPEQRSEYEVPRHIWVTLDTEGPQTYAPKAVTVKQNSKPAFDFWVNDDLSDKAKVTIVVKNGGGSTVKTLSLGWLPTWREFSAPISDWKCTLAKGSYTFDVRAEDQAGNGQVSPAGNNTFTVN